MSRVMKGSVSVGLIRDYTSRSVPAHRVPEAIMSQVVTVLNLIWLLVSVAAIGALLVSERGRSSAGMARIHRLIAVLLVTVSLFPCVSASDDVISFTYVSAGLET